MLKREREIVILNWGNTVLKTILLAYVCKYSKYKGEFSFCFFFSNNNYKMCVDGWLCVNPNLSIVPYDKRLCACSNIQYRQFSVVIIYTCVAVIYDAHRCSCSFAHWSVYSNKWHEIWIVCF